MSSLRLCDLTLGRAAKIVGFTADTPREAVDRFRALGFLEGADVTVKRLLPFGGPLVVAIGGSMFALERPASACVQVSDGGVG